MDNKNIHKGLVIEGYNWNYFDDETKLHTFSKKVNNPYGYNVIKCLPSDIRNNNINDMCKMELSRNNTYYKDMLKERIRLKQDLKEIREMYNKNPTPELLEEVQELKQDLRDLSFQLVI